MAGIGASLRPDAFRDDDSDDEESTRSMANLRPVKPLPSRNKARSVRAREPEVLRNRFEYRPGPALLEPYKTILCPATFLKRSSEYQCGWKGCDAVLGNEELLVKHVWYRQHTSEASFKVAVSQRKCRGTPTDGSHIIRRSCGSVIGVHAKDRALRPSKTSLSTSKHVTFRAFCGVRTTTAALLLPTSLISPATPCGCTTMLCPVRSPTSRISYRLPRSCRPRYLKWPVPTSLRRTVCSDRYSTRSSAGIG